MSNNQIIIIGAGLAGSEAAYQCAKRGVKVKLFEAKPNYISPAHKTEYLAELVCSNSLKSDEPTNAHGLLKAELRLLDSLLLRCAVKTKIPGGKALVVNRELFAKEVTKEIAKLSDVEIIREEVSRIPENGIIIIATGPLTSESLSKELASFCGEEHLFFYDAISPIVAAQSINYERTFFGSRYRNDNDYLNCPLTKDEYEKFYNELINAELFPLRDFENGQFFEGCLPIEEIAKRGKDTLAYGPMKPVGLKDPRTNKTPYAVVQLRKENQEGTMYNLVGFQTRLRHKEQEKVFHLIPGLENAEFLRYGSVHRNTYINAPKILKPTLQTIKRETLFISGQLCGVEGYVESIGTGLWAGINAARILSGKEPITPPAETMLGGLIKYITTPNNNFQPMNANFGLSPPVPSPNKSIAGETSKSRYRKQEFYNRSIQTLTQFIITI
ncbi:MAG: methylenetetrahydrofolate--tRNA-(uracil(54)-C(5))-methyltransferase (FADH(2)-oxidizing) TrmFO [candidate division WOR-3 bacterium]|nr:methylenetetrahydrofolate--tRNA-(uracil(54)-C(5))-methyltransferase (FADH(2)-oxidizing) TrmFO [candidate division WOR-3 bacterium]